MAYRISCSSIILCHYFSMFSSLWFHLFMILKFLWYLEGIYFCSRGYLHINNISNTFNHLLLWILSFTVILKLASICLFSHFSFFFPFSFSNFNHWHNFSSNVFIPMYIYFLPDLLVSTYTRILLNNLCESTGD